MKIPMAVVTAAAAMLATAPACAQSSQLSAQDKQFLAEAGPSSTIEVKMGQLAKSKAAAPAVQEFGRWMISAHSLANKLLEQIVSNHYGMSIRMRPLVEQRQDSVRLSELTGTEFDKAYVDMMVMYQGKALEVFEKEAQHGQARLVTQYARNLLPVIEEQLAEAKELQRRLQ